MSDDNQIRGEIDKIVEISKSYKESVKFLEDNKNIIENMLEDEKKIDRYLNQLHRKINRQDRHIKCIKENDEIIEKKYRKIMNSYEKYSNMESGTTLLTNLLIIGPFMINQQREYVQKKIDKFEIRFLQEIKKMIKLHYELILDVEEIDEYFNIVHPIFDEHIKITLESV